MAQPTASPTLTLDQIEARRATCRSCEHAKPCPGTQHATRRCTCGIDGHDLRLRTATPESACPAGKWPAIRVPLSARILPPGTWLAMLIQVATLGLVRPCANCKSRMAAMNRVGWSGLPTLWTRWLRAKLGRRPRPAT